MLMEAKIDFESTEAQPQLEAMFDVLMRRGIRKINSLLLVFVVLTQFIGHQSHAQIKLSQAITFNALPTKLAGEVPFTLHASATSGLLIVYTSSNPFVATIAGNVLTITGVGTSEITASQPGDSAYDPATPVPQMLTVNGVNGARLVLATSDRGALAGGTIVSVGIDGSQPLVNTAFDAAPVSPGRVTLMQSSNGDLYGTTAGGGQIISVLFTR
jgi:hypothetical protein